MTDHLISEGTPSPSEPVAPRPPVASPHALWTAELLDLIGKAAGDAAKSVVRQQHAFDQSDFGVRRRVSRILADARRHLRHEDPPAL